jgi:mannose-1-phosphate guanylyltransferase
VKALILAAGLGSRLGNVTRDIPKPLVTVGKQTILEHNIRKLLAIGVTEIIINTHYKSEKIQAFIESSNFDISVKSSYEEELLGTGGTLAKHIDTLAQNDFIVMHSDNFFESSLKCLLDTHLNHETFHLGTLATFRTEVPSETGIIELSPDGTIRKFYEKVKNPPGNLASAAIMILRPEVKSLILEMGKNCQDISRDVIPLLCSRLVTAELKGYFLDIGTQEALKSARKIADEDYL